MTEGKIKVLFLCTGNACRSQMAEGWARHLKGETIEAYSAGICPIGVSWRAIETMSQAGVDITGQRSRHFNEFSDVNFDYVVTLCDNAAERCPVFGGTAKVIHKPFEDPYFATGTEEQVMAEFREARDLIRVFVEGMPENLKSDK
jgi:arsenate reductase